MKKIKCLFQNRNLIHTLMAYGAMVFATHATTRFCYYIFHQPKLPDEFLQEEYLNGENS